MELESAKWVNGKEVYPFMREPLTNFANPSFKINNFIKIQLN